MYLCWLILFLCIFFIIMDDFFIFFIYFYGGLLFSNFTLLTLVFKFSFSLFINNMWCYTSYPYWDVEYTSLV